MDWYIRHGHWEQVNDEFGVERLEDISRQQRVVNTTVFVFFELRQLILPNVHHLERVNDVEVCRNEMMKFVACLC